MSPGAPPQTRRRPPVLDQVDERQWAASEVEIKDCLADACLDGEADQLAEVEIKDCLADACLDGEADQLAEVLRIRSEFLAVQRSVRTEVEAEFQKFAESPWDINSAIGEYKERCLAQPEDPSPKGSLPSSPHRSTSLPAEDELSSAAASPRPGQPSRVPPPPLSPRRMPPRGANSAPHSPAGSPPGGVPQLRRFFPTRTYASRTNTGVPESQPAQPAAKPPAPGATEPKPRTSWSREYSEASTTASSVGSSPHVGIPRRRPTSAAPVDASGAAQSPSVGRRHSIALQIQQRLLQRQTELSDLERDVATGVDGADNSQPDTPNGSASAGAARAARSAARSARAADAEQEGDWYSPPEAYIWAGVSMSGSAYAFSFAPESGPPSRASPRARSDASGDARASASTYSFRFSSGEQKADMRGPWSARTASGSAHPGQSASWQATSKPAPSNATPPRPPQASAPPPGGQRSSACPNAKQPPQAATPPRPPRPPPTRSGNCPWSAHGGPWRRDGVPFMRFPGMHGSSGWGEWAHSERTHKQPPPSPPPPPKRPSPMAAAAAAARTPVEATAQAKLEVRLQELRRLSRDEQRKGSKELMVQWHPDKNPDRGEEATRVFQWLQNRRKELLGF